MRGAAMITALNLWGVTPFLLLAVAAWIWMGAMAGPPGVICGLHSNPLGPHCWRCFAAAALAIAGLVGLRLSTPVKARR